MIKKNTMRQKYIIQFFLFLLITFLFITNCFSQSAASVSKTNSFAVPVNTILCLITLILLLIIIVLAITVNAAIGLYKLKSKDNDSIDIKNISVFIGLFIISNFAYSHDVVSTSIVDTGAEMASKWYFYSFISVIIVEVGIILFFIRALSFLTGIDSFKKTQTKNVKTIWETINQFKPIEDEENMDTGHNYDGIRELDNITPPWFIAGFVASIIFAAIYMYRYHIAESAPLMLEEYAIEMKQAQIFQDSILKLEGNKVDENTVVMLDGKGIELGNKLYIANCAACHGDKGQGGVGPNLTDQYWLHGGSIKDVFKVIKYGWIEKGMKSWKDDFSPTQIAQLSSYVESLKGTNPVGSKEKQGELYVEELSIAIEGNVKIDSLKTN